MTLQRDLPIAIMGSLLVCVVLYIGVCLVITGMVPYKLLGEDAPLAEAFTSKGLKYVSILISIGAVAGLTTTLLVGLYVQVNIETPMYFTWCQCTNDSVSYEQSRLYLGLGRDGLLPSLFARVHPKAHTPVHSQIWVGIVASILAGLFNIHALSHILSVGSLVCWCLTSVYNILKILIISYLSFAITSLGSCNYQSHHVYSSLGFRGKKELAC